MPKCQKCPIIVECRNQIGLVKKNEKGEITNRGCPLLMAFFNSWALFQAHPELFKKIEVKAE